eukprot:TRINITY_DN4019_c0_g2_i1.p1 TRINITY_DN4019_c0_g2~~TRINITY_DN4019_c0_g2_i1.p1  ORF type:complete len:157 (+),score=46.47 TRINITY_DN4019_c0_g2_i1:70-540(+)
MATPTHPLDMHVVDTGLLLGGASAASDVKMLEAQGVTHVLTVMRGGLFPPYRWPHAYLLVEVLDWDSEDLKSHFAECNKFIDEGRAAGKVLVHCGAGISRSPTVVIAYLMWKLNLSFNDAYAKVLAARPYIEPNSGFVQQLKLYESELNALKNPFT